MITLIASAFCKLRLGTVINDRSSKVATEITPHAMTWICYAFYLKITTQLFM